MADSETILREYTTKVDYPAIYRPEAAPKEIALAAALRGYDAADLTAPFTYCDLACGPGETVVLLAKCYPHAQFFGIDINPSHIAQAKRRAEELGVENLTLLEGDFRHLDRLSLPKFDFIAVLGVLSWIPLKLQRIALEAAAKLLKPSGLMLTHYAAAPIAGISRAGPSILAMLTPSDLHGTVEGAKTAFNRFDKLAKSNTGIYPQLAPQVNSIKNSFKLDPDYALHDFFHSATTLSFEDFSDIMEEFGLEFAACSRLGQIVPQAFVAEDLIKPFDFENEWETSQPLLQTLARESSRLDIFARSDARSRIIDVFTKGSISGLFVENWSENAIQALETANKNSPIDLLHESYKEIVTTVSGTPEKLGSLVTSFGSSTAEQEDGITRIAHLLAHRVLNLRFGNGSELTHKSELKLETFEFADDLWKYLTVNRALPIPSIPNGGCMTFNNDGKIKLYLMLKGDPNRLLQRVKRMPGFTGIRTQQGAVQTGAQLQSLMAPELANYTEYWTRMFHRYGIA